ncbi:MAG: hypothetical protein Fur0018_09650 [Anaerolineales bacterium]
MKRAVSISIGSSKRDKSVEVTLLGEQVRIERIGTDGDMKKAAALFRELDGQVDAFGVGGADLGIMVDTTFYPLRPVWKMIKDVKHTPVVDGAGLKNTLEYRIADALEAEIGDYLNQVGRRVLVATAADRWGMAASFVKAGYECTFGDLMFGLGIPIPFHNLETVRKFAAVVGPIVGYLPFEWVYPTGEKQEQRIPKWGKYYQWASVIAGDCHYVRRHMPEHLNGKVIATNTTTERDVELFQQAGVKYLLTATPVLDGRSFGTNMMEAALIAVSGKKRPLTREELNKMLDQMDVRPQIRELN